MRGEAAMDERGFGMASVRFICGALADRIAVTA
jgi:hypothetical protein